MKQLVTFRLDPELLERLRQTACAENRTLTNFVETVLKRSFPWSEVAPRASPRADRDPGQG